MRVWAVARHEVCAGETAAAATGTGVGVVVGVARLQLADHVASVRLGARVLSLRALAEEVRQSDRGQDANDQDYNEGLDQRETGLLSLNTRAELPQHVCDLLMRDLGLSTRGIGGQEYDL